ncbi:hypothetical protein AWB93_23150 [Mycobacterium bohemicum]|uniref:Mce protein n=1 Tax=Mycobacterium bohemicum TaxID=56425 RepID=A0A1X1QX96_MYCBE|nr:hypothetical protein [Mycobacterium bohemicum]ORU96005.1 hypothetical protein AWB93_23150 [Mycobacterium bohemicum]
MAEVDDQEEEPVTSKADALALIEEAEAEAAEAEALAAAARARARAARLRREALALADAAEDYGDAAAAAADSADDEDETYYEEPADQDYAEYYDETPGDELHGTGAAEDDEAFEDEDAPPPTGWRRWVPSPAAAATVAAVVLVIGFAAASTYMVLQHRDATRQQRHEAEYVAGAKRGVVSMISLDFTKAKADVQRVIDTSTGPFRDDFQRRANDFIAVVEQSKAITEGTVNAAAVESVGDDSAVVLVAATSRVTNSPPGKEEPPKIWRLRVTVADEGGKYKMSKVEYVP